MTNPPQHPNTHLITAASIAADTELQVFQLRAVAPWAPSDRPGGPYTMCRGLDNVPRNLENVKSARWFSIQSAICEVGDFDLIRPVEA